MLTIAQIAAVVAAGALAQLTDEQVSDAGHSVQFAMDPTFLGDEPHLRHEVDACGLAETDLLVLDGAVWAETARREEIRIEANWRQGPVALPLAA